MASRVTRTPLYLLSLAGSRGNRGLSHSTLRVYRNGEYSEYTGPRKADGIISYMVKCAYLVACTSLPCLTLRFSGSLFLRSLT